MNFEFKVINAHEVDYSKRYNGNDGNYEKLAVYFNGKLVTEVYDCDYNIIQNDFVRDTLNGSEFEIKNGKVVESYWYYGTFVPYE